MFNTTFLVIDEVIQVQTMPEFVNQDSYDGGSAHKYNCALKPLSILTFLPTSLSTCLKWKIKKNIQENEWN